MFSASFSLAQLRPNINPHPLFLLVRPAYFLTMRQVQKNTRLEKRVIKCMSTATGRNPHSSLEQAEVQ